MTKTIETFDNQTAGHVGLGFWGDKVGSIKQIVYDGDTILVRSLGNFSIRFLSIDTAEMKIPLPAEKAFTSLSDQKWNQFLSDPFAPGGPMSPSPFSNSLTNYIKGKAGPNKGTNHKKYADAAEDLLTELIEFDLNEMGVQKEDFKFYLRFAYEIMDRYGRFLCFINRDQPDENVPSPRPLDYNGRVLFKGLASPYFIWPNINPWRQAKTIESAVLKPGTANIEATRPGKLKDARDAIKANRANHVGIYDSSDPLCVEAFEIRYLSRCSPPDRWVIDLNKNDDVLIHPESYHTVANTEDRLFIPAEYVPLFVEAGWKRQQKPL